MAMEDTLTRHIPYDQHTQSSNTSISYRVTQINRLNNSKILKKVKGNKNISLARYEVGYQKTLPLYYRICSSGSEVPTARDG